MKDKYEKMKCLMMKNRKIIVGVFQIVKKAKKRMLCGYKIVK